MLKTVVKRKREKSFIFLYDFKQKIAKKGNSNIETLRGIAIILVVFGHIIGSAKEGGMKVADDSIFRYLYFSLEYIRLPLFTVISGWVYAKKPITIGCRKKFLSGKIRRLLVPMFVISTILFLFRVIIPGTNHKPDIDELYNNLVFPYDLYWYLFSLFLIFIVIALLDTRAFFHKFYGWLATFICALLFLLTSANFLEGIPNFFSFKGAIYLFPFFLLGIAFYRFKNRIFTRRNTFIFLSIFLITFIIQQAIWFNIFPEQSRQSLLGLSVGISGVCLLFKLKLKNNLLLFLGNFAFPIYLFHVFFTGGTRIFLLKIGIDDKGIILITSLFISLWGPIIFDLIIKKSKLLSFLLLGLRNKVQLTAK